MDKKIYSSPAIETAPLSLSACIMSGEGSIEANSGDSGHTDPIPVGHHGSGAPRRVF